MVETDQHWTQPPTPRWLMSVAQQGQPYLWSWHPCLYLDPCQGRLQDLGAARHPSYCCQAGDWAQDPNLLGKAPRGMNLGLLGTEQACLQVNSLHARVADHGLLQAHAYIPYMSPQLYQSQILPHMLCCVSRRDGSVEVILTHCQYLSSSKALSVSSSIVPMQHTCTKFIKFLKEA